METKVPFLEYLDASKKLNPEPHHFEYVDLKAGFIVYHSMQPLGALSPLRWFGTLGCSFVQDMR